MGTGTLKLQLLGTGPSDVWMWTIGLRAYDQLTEYINFFQMSRGKTKKIHDYHFLIQVSR